MTDILHSIDEPIEWRADRPLLVISGWCIGAGDAVRAIEALVDGELQPIQLSLPRPEVATKHPEVPGALESGFRVALALAPGRHEIVLRALRESRSVVEFLRKSIDAGISALQGNVETLRTAVPAGSVHFTGWCLHPQAPLTRVALRVRGELHDCRHALPRPDVARVFVDIPLAGHSGFEVRVDLPPGRHAVVLVGVLESGETLELPFADRVDVLSDSLLARGARNVRHRMLAVANVARMGRRWIARRGHLPGPRDWPRLVTKAWHMVVARRSSGVHALPGGFEVPAVVDRYDAWLEWNRWTERRGAWLATRLDAAGARPTISIVMPVYRPDRKWLDRAIETVRAQVDARWELCIADDASADPALAAHLSALAAGDPRIKVALRPENGNISRATNTAAELATGDFLLFLDQDDELPPDAVGEIALALAAAPDADILYTDDDKIDIEGRRYSPQFKPDWSPELLLSYMYMSHAFVVRREMFADLGGFRAGFEGAQDFDFALRATERARRIVHVPLVLYHWRAVPGSTASSGAAKPASFDAGIRAVDDALARRGSRGRAARPPWAYRAGIGLFWHEFPDDGPRVALLIPTRNNHALLARCLESLAQTTYRDFEIVVVDNESDDPASREYLAGLPHRVLRIGNPGPRFSFAHINNEAARAVDADFLLFLNDDTEVCEPRWLSRMMGYAQMHGVGAVGARLLYPDGRIQHAGVLHGYYDGLPGPAFKLASATDHGYLAYAMVVRNYGAVTGACLLTPRRLFLESGAFDERNFAIAFNDVDYGFRLEAAGLRCVYVPGAELVHHEGGSRGFDDDPREAAAYRARYGRRVERYYNPNLSLADERFAIAPRRAFAAAPPGPIRALMCAFNLNWEGAPHSQFEMTAELKRRGVLDPIVYAPEDGPLRAAYEGEGIPVHVAPHPLAGVSTSPDYEAAIVRFCGWVRSLDVRVVYGNTLQTFYAIDAAHRLGLPSVWNPRESEPWNEYFRQYPDAMAAPALGCYAYPYRIVFVAHATAEGSAAIDTRHNFTVIHNGLDRRRLAAAAAGIDRDAARRSLGVDPGDVVLLLVGTVCDRKGQHDLARALALLPRAAAARVRAFFVGDRDSAYSRALHALVAAVPEERRPRIVAETGDVARYFIASDIFVCTSRVESYPRVILEAMAYGLPVVTTPVFGIREQVREGINGIFYDPGNVKALAAAIARLVDDDALRTRLAGNAVPVLDALTDFDAMVDHYGRVFVEAAAP